MEADERHGAGPRGVRLWLACIAVAAAVPRLVVSRIRGIEYDGWWHIFVSRQNSLSDFWREVLRNAHPPLFYALLRAADVLGRSRTAYCFVSIASGVAAVYLLGRIASRIASRPAAILASCAMAFSASAVLLSTAVRSYMLAIAFLLASFLGYLGLLEEGPRIRTKDLALFFGGAILAMLSHNFSVFYLAAALAVGTVVLFCARGPQRATLLRRFRGRANVLIPGAGALALLAMTEYLVQWRRWRTPMDYIATRYFQPAGGRSALAFAATGFAREAALFAPLGIPGGLLAMIAAVAAVLLFAEGLRSWRRNDPTAPARVVVPAMFAAITILIAVASLLQRYPFGGAMRHQSIVLPFGILTLVIGVDRVARRSRSGKANVAVWCSAFALVAANAVFQMRHPPPLTIDNRGQVAAFLEGAPVTHDFYSDQFSFIPLFAAHANCAWRALGPVPGSGGALRYDVDCGTRKFEIYRDARWNLDLATPAARSRLETTLAAAGLRCMTCFHIDQAPGGPAIAETEAAVRTGLGPTWFRRKGRYWAFEFCRPGSP